MGRYKCAYNCESSSDSDLKFFKFPLYNPRKLKKWLNNMKWDDWTPTRFSVLCSNHFEEQYIDRTGKSVTLKDNAIPTIFNSSDATQKTKTSANTRSKQNKPPAVKATQMISTQSQTTDTSTANPSIQNEESSLTEEPSGVTEQSETERWRIIVDEGLSTIESFPHFFHGDYCVPQRDIQWAPDYNAECRDPEKLIEVTEPWQWLGLDVRGPLPETLNGHRYMLTLTDYYSKWVEALPMDALLPEHVAKHITEIIDHFGFPLRVLSRLPQDMVQKINSELKEQLKVTASLVIHHQQTGSADLITEQLIDRMVNELVEEHTPDWDVYLPAKVFSLCFTEHSQTKERPFSVLCCKELEPIKSPRGLDCADSKIQESAFVVRWSGVI
ncbi:uncharacterized protein zgc:153292 [Notolabrus celidotus]|uniref:uncharacterized protein zgc:153292 n=1 Tax=Notolabrus celidotus TaxID=1203425 RepID=UPI00148F628E|nr:uncharacterized protein zgc:153292 [Notolabrus celidotus]